MSFLSPFLAINGHDDRPEQFLGSLSLRNLPLPVVSSKDFMHHFIANLIFGSIVFDLVQVIR